MSLFYNIVNVPINFLYMDPSHYAEHALCVAPHFCAGRHILSDMRKLRDLVLLTAAQLFME